MKLRFFIPFLIAIPLMAQAPVAVTATVVAPNGPVYGNGAFSVFLVDSTGKTFPNPTINNFAISRNQFSGTTSSTGLLSVSLYPNSQFDQAGTQWKFNICSAQASFPSVLTASQCFTVTTTITGAGDISATINAAAVNLFSFNPSTGAASFLFPDLTSQVTAAFRTPGIWVSPLCPAGSTTCIKVFQDAQYVSDVTSNSTTTITCPDCSFTQKDVGKVAWAVTQGTGVGVGQALNTTYVCPQTTISSVTNSTTAVLGTACTANATANAVFVWGHDDGATLAAANFGCNVVHLSTGTTFLMVGQPFFNTAPTTCNQFMVPSQSTLVPFLLGDGFGASQALIIITPNFNYTSCASISGASAKICIGGAARGLANIEFWGTGLNAASNSNCANANGVIMVSPNPLSSVVHGVNVGGICGGQAGMIGIEEQAADEEWDQGGAQMVGIIACNFYTGSNMMAYAQDCRNDQFTNGIGLQVANGATVGVYTSNPIAGAKLTGSGSSLVSVNTKYISGGTNIPTVETSTGTTFNSFSDNFSGYQLDSGGTHITSGSVYSTQPVNNGKWINNGGNTYTQGMNSSGGGKMAGTNIIFGSCKGTATAATTIFLNPAGQTSTNACTATSASGGGTPVNIATGLTGAVIELICSAKTGGVNSSSGVVTVLRNGSSTVTSGPITCTFGTGTFCEDHAHFDNGTGGVSTDFYGFQVTTQTAETLSDITCTLIAQ